MGKHKKIINNDPILKRDYKYQKRKKERAQQKMAERELREKEEKAKRQLAEIQNEVQQEIRNELLSRADVYKEKKIQKLPKELFCRKSITKQEKVKESTVNKQVLALKDCAEDNQPDFYTMHFGVLPARIKCIRGHKESQRDVIDKEVKQQIKGMFSFEGDKQKTAMEPEPRKTVEKQVGGDDSNPYILVKSQSREKEVVINGQINLFTEEAYFRKQTLILTSKSNQVRKSVISSYKDYVHIEDKQESTIEEFRRIVLGHLVAHENRCRKEEDNSKGFTNGKALVLCPFFGDAKSIIEIFQSFYEGYQTINKEKLQTIEDENDFFRIGICVNDRKKTIKYFSHFNVSNFIIGSPVGIKAIVGTESDSERDFSFLSSVQILYIDRASVIYMQNWDHLIEVLKSLNSMPNPDSICNDINKLRPSVPQLLGKIYRQSIVFSEFNFPQINGLKYLHFNNWEGCITTKNLYSPLPDSRKTEYDIQFYKMELKSPKDDLDMRFQFFKRKFWQQIYNTESMKKAVIFTRSYFQFIKLKQFLIRANASADFISEHTKKPKVQSKIAGFNACKYRILVITERAYYYGICQIKKLQHLYFYSLPRNAFIYSELIAQIIKQYSYVRNKVVAIYTKYDSMSLERIVGSKKSVEMVKEYCSNVSFVI